MHVIDLAEQLESNQIYKHLVLSLLESDNLDEILWKIIEDAISKLGFEDCVVYILENQDTLVQKAAYGPKNPDGRTIKTPITIPLGQGIVGAVAKTGIPERIANTKHDLRYIVDDEARLSELTVPIIYNDKVIGVLDSENSQENYFTEIHLEQFLTIARLAAPQIFHALTREHLYQLNKTLQDSSIRYKQLVEHCPDAIVVHQNERIIYHNVAFTNLVLFKHGESLKNRELQEFICEEHHKPFRKSLADMSDSVSWCQVEITTSYCTRINVEAMSLSIPIQDGEAVQTIFHDITAYKRKEQELTAATLKAEAANQTKSQLLSRISHELRTPLNAIIGFAQLQQIKFPDLPEDVQRGNQEIFSAGQHLLALVNDILDISQIEQRKLQSNLVSCDLWNVLESCISLVKPEANARDITIVAKSFDYPVLADSTRLKQVLVNVLSNAVKYNHQGGKVSVQACRSEHGNIELRITDTGIGIAEDKFSIIFEPFTRLKQAEQHLFEGAGIGLSLSKALLQEMHGSIRVESQQNKGSTFIVGLKSANEQTSVADLQPAPEVFAEIELSVLYVEDDRSNVELIKKVFDMFPQVTLMVTRNGKEGIALASEKVFDLIMLDMDLPDMNGIEVLQQLRKLGSQSKFIALSENTVPAQVNMAIASGFDFCLTKPLQLPELSSYLRLVNTKSARPKS